MSLCHLVDKTPQDLTEYFAHVAAQPFAMLLDSAASNHPNSRFDILVAQPRATLTAHGQHCTLLRYALNCSSVIATQEMSSDPFLLLKQLQTELLPSINRSSLPAAAQALPFIGGVLGYFGYDLGRVLEPLSPIACHDISMPDLAVGFYDWALVLDKHQQQLWFCDLNGAADSRWPMIAALLSADAKNNAIKADINKDGTDCLNHAVHQRVTKTSNASYPSHFHLVSDWQANMTAHSHQQKIAAVQAYLQSGDCYQINLAQRFSATYQGDEYQAYLALRAANQAPFSAFIRLPQGAVLSVSPERFLEVKDRLIETKPIKGTRPRFADPVLDADSADALRQSPKDRAENVMIVDLLRNDLGKVASPGTVTVPQLFAIESFPAVHHLVSTVTAELSAQYQAIDALRAAFPGGSITGAPKVRAMQIIEELEPHRRNVYCGAIGYLSQHGHMDTNIAIRTLVAADNQLYCWAGGGIVADSEAASEYQETLDKVRHILPVLAAL